MSHGSGALPQDIVSSRFDSRFVHGSNLPVRGSSGGLWVVVHATCWTVEEAAWGARNLGVVVVA